jgi:hypothetical protein
MSSERIVRRRKVLHANLARHFQFLAVRAITTRFETHHFDVAAQIDVVHALLKFASFRLEPHASDIFWGGLQRTYSHVPDRGLHVHPRAAFQ